MNLTLENSRDYSVSAIEKLSTIFSKYIDDNCDAEYTDAKKSHVIGFCGTKYYLPLCMYALNDEKICNYLDNFKDNDSLFVINKSVDHITENGKVSVPQEINDRIMEIYDGLSNSAGYIDENGAHVIDLKLYPVGSHFDVNLLLGNRVGFDNPLLTTPKAALDSLGRGSFRAAAETQVLANRYVLRMQENGEPVNRQFYIVENGIQIFYSADPYTNVKDAKCYHLQNRTIIEYETICGLKIKRTIFILPQEEGMPEAVEVQRVEVLNLTNINREIKVVFTGVFGIFDQGGVAGDIVYVNIVHESGIVKDGDEVVALSPHFNPAYGKRSRRFSVLLSDGEYMDEYSCNYDDFVGRGDINFPENVANLENKQSRKCAPFFAMSKKLSLRPNSSKCIDSFVGIVSDPVNADESFKELLGNLVTKYKDADNLTDTYNKMVKFVESYSSYINFESKDSNMNTYISKNLPFQVLYQSFVTRAFAWTQKSGRQVGFREIQDMYASMYYMAAMGNSDLAKKMLIQWANNVYEYGYANHNFYWEGNGAGGASDDQLWLIQAVYRYVMLTGDKSFLTEQCKIAGTDKTRTVFDTMMAAVNYSGKISLGKHGLPLLDGCDWNDCLCLDRDCSNGPGKIEMYKKQIAEKGIEWGSEPIENHWVESVMNAFLLKLAYDNFAILADSIDKTEIAEELRLRSKVLNENIQKFAWKEDFFARCLLNNPDFGYTYLGGKGDGLSSNPDFPGSYWLNSFSWSILSDSADDNQIEIMLNSIEKYIKTPSGLTLTSPCAMERISTTTAQDHYFHGDRENGAVFKHATMMATAAMFKAAKKVKDESLAQKLAEMGFWMLDLVVPYSTLKTPFITKGNPRFCTQYNNSETRENIGPMLSGTASWLALTTFEYLGINHKEGGFELNPILPFNLENAKYTIHADGSDFNVIVKKPLGFARPTSKTVYKIDGKVSDNFVKYSHDNKSHDIEIII